MRFTKAAPRVGLSIAAMLAFGACAAPADEHDPAVGTTSQQLLSTPLSTYASGDDIVVTYSNMSGATTDWIALAAVTDGAESYEAWTYTGGGTSGTVTFHAPPLSSGSNEARAYYDWDGTSSFTIQQRSPAFTFTSGATVTPSASSYPFGSPVTISYTGFTGSTTDWIAIYAPGAPSNDHYAAFQYTGGGTSGQLTFNDLPAGSYEARYFPDYTGTHSYSPGAISSVFTVGASPTVSTDAKRYGAGQNVTVSYTNLPGNSKDFVAVATAGAPADTVLQRFYTNGQINGSQVFSGLPAGSYEARTYANDTFTELASSTFTVSGTTVSTDATSYTLTQPIVVTYAGMPGNQLDWVGIALAGSPDTSYIDYAYTAGAASGSASFSDLPPGTYEARAYYNNSYVVEARSAQFTVGTTCMTTSNPPVLASLTSGDLVIDASSVSATAPIVAPLGTSILFTSLNEAEPSPAFGGVGCVLQAEDDSQTPAQVAGVMCHRQTAGTDYTGSTGVINVHWTIATFSSGVTVQRGLANTSASNPNVTTLSPAVDPSSSFVLLGGEWGGGTGWGNNEFAMAQLASDGSTVTVSNNTAGSTSTWQVVTMTGATVQRGTTSLSSITTDQQVAISTAETGSIALASYTTDNQTGVAAAEMMVQTSLLNSNTLDLQRVAGGTNLVVSWEVVSLPFATHTGVATFAAGALSATGTASGIAAASSVALSGSEAELGQSCGSSAYTGSQLDLLGETAATMVTGTDSVTLTRQSALAAATIPWQVIDFAHNCAGQ